MTAGLSKGGPGRCDNQVMLRITWQALSLLAVLCAAAGLVVERRSGKRRIPKGTFVGIVIILLLGGIGVLLALIGTALE